MNEASWGSPQVEILLDGVPCTLLEFDLRLGVTGGARLHLVCEVNVADLPKQAQQEFAALAAPGQRAIKVPR